MDKKTCFVVSVIGKENSNEREHADSVFDYIIEPALSNEFEVTRADKMYHADKIDNKIFSSLQSADLVVADLTGNNPNVFFRNWLSHGSWKTYNVSFTKEFRTFAFRYSKYQYLSL